VAAAARGADADRFETLGGEVATVLASGQQPVAVTGSHAQPAGRPVAQLDCAAVENQGALSERFFQRQADPPAFGHTR
jgi:hypothetical protein